MLDHFFTLLFPKDSEPLKISDIRLREVGAKRLLNGTSKVNRRTNTPTDRRTNRLIESIGPEGRCFENQPDMPVLTKLRPPPWPDCPPVRLPLMAGPREWGKPGVDTVCYKWWVNASRPVQHLPNLPYSERIDSPAVAIPLLKVM